VFSPLRCENDIFIKIRMKITKIQIKNYRLLKNFSVNLENDLSLIIGKNNTGKTSLLNILQKFLCTTLNTFNFEDFNIEFQEEIIKKIEATLVEEDGYKKLKLELNIFIKYEENDSLANISDLFLDLEPSNNELKLCFEYELGFENYKKLKEDYTSHELGRGLTDFLKKHHKAYFKMKRKVIDTADENIFAEVEDSKIRKIINIQFISAQRDVSNEDGEGTKNKTLSKLSYKYFKPFEDSKAAHVIDLQKKLIDTDTNLTSSYALIFKKVIDDVEKFSYNSSKISVRSNFEEINLLKENTSVVYSENDCLLPENYNGLGYMNLFSMIFELHIIFDQFKKTHQEQNSSDINLLFIEEPEAHTHPQMQYVFIKNIKQFLQENKETLNLQTVITTHSAHITSQSDFSNIKYFLEKDYQVIVKNLSDLETHYGESGDEKINFKFLKQYLTIHRAELFFSDKIIFIEGDTERILLPAIMKKLDLQNVGTKNYIPLLSQKISIVEVGAHSKIFDKFLEFLGIKTLIITDIDSVKENGARRKTRCKVSEGTDTSNVSIKHFLPGKSFEELKNITEEARVISCGDAKIYISYQNKESDYHARSFEDAFISLNIDYIQSKKEDFNSLKNKEKFDDPNPDFYKIANYDEGDFKCIIKKSDFATDILYLSDENFTNWETPDYIKKGLLWLMKN